MNQASNALQPKSPLNQLSDSDIARLSKLETLYVNYDQTQRACEMLRRFHMGARETSGGKFISLIGDSGAGKTTVIELYCASIAVPTVDLDKNDVTPVVFVTVPEDCTVKELCVRLLAALGDPYSHRGTKFEIEARIKPLVQNKGVELIILDEFQHMIDPERGKVAHTTLEWLKTQMNTLNVGFVLVGLPEFEEVVHDNLQWHRRSRGRFQLHPFSWSTPDDRNRFLSFLGTIEALVPVPNNDGCLRTGNLPARIIYATGGHVAFVMRLIRQAAEEAIDQEAETLTAHHFQKAYNVLEGFSKPKENNPFMPNFKRKGVIHDIHRKTEVLQ